MVLVRMIRLAQFSHLAPSDLTPTGMQASTRWSARNDLGHKARKHLDSVRATCARNLCAQHAESLWLDASGRALLKAPHGMQPQARDAW